MVGTEGSEPKGEQETQKTEGPLSSFLIPVLSFVGTGIGVLGFVVFFGGFVTWSRFDAAGVPANEAVARIPRNDLVVTGASFLVPALLAALVAVAVTVLLWDLVIGGPRRRLVRPAEQRLADDIREASTLEERIAHLDQLLENAHADMERRGMAVTAAAVGAAREEALEFYNAADARHQEYESQRDDLQDRLIDARRSASHAKSELDYSRFSADRRDRWLKVVVGGAPMLVAQLLVIAMAIGSVRWHLFPLLVLVAALTIAVAVTVVSMTSFTWYAVSVFVGVGIVIAASTYMRTQSNPKISPVVALDGDEPVTGFFVAETGDSLYVARPAVESGAGFELDHDAITMSHIPKKTIKFLSVGPLKTEEVAYRRSIELAVALCDRLETRRNAVPAASPASTTTPAKKDNVKPTPAPANCHEKGVGDLRTTLAGLPQP